MFSKFSFSQIIFEKHFSSGQGWTVKEVSDGFISCGSNGSSLLLAKADSHGDFVWEKQFENIYVTGIANSLSGGSNYFLNKYSMEGDTLSAHTYPVSSSWQTIYAKDMVFSNGKFYIAGRESGNNPNEAVLMCVDANGVELFRHHFGGNSHDEFFGLAMTSDSNIICVGESSSFNPGREIYLVKVDPEIILAVPTNEHEIPFELSYTENVLMVNLRYDKLFCKINLFLYDLGGKIVCESKTNSNYSEINISSLRSGIYLLSLEFDSQKIVRKIFIK